MAYGGHEITFKLLIAFALTDITFNGNEMSNITTKLLLSAFEKPKKSKSYELYSTIFFEKEDYADYYIHVDKTNGKVACSKSESMEDIRSVDGNEASRLLCGLTIDTTLYEKVQNFLVRRHQTKMYVNIKSGARLEFTL